MWTDVGRDREQERQRKMRDKRSEQPDKDSDQMMRRAGFWMVFMLGAAALGNVFSLRRRLLNIEREFGQGHRSQASGGFGSSGPNQRTRGSQQYSRQTSAQESQQQWQAHIEELQRRERIRRMQEAFARERGTYTKTYDAWRERHGDTWEWRWEGNRWEWKGEEQRRQAEEDQEWKRNEERKNSSSYDLLKRARVAHHFSVLGLDASRPQPYTETEIKAAFRTKALEYHPDQNQGNKQVAEVKFRQLLESYHTLRAHFKLK
jgi:hypothetical protein